MKASVFYDPYRNKFSVWQDNYEIQPIGVTKRDRPKFMQYRGCLLFTRHYHKRRPKRLNLIGPFNYSFPKKEKPKC